MQPIDHAPPRVQHPTVAEQDDRVGVRVGEVLHLADVDVSAFVSSAPNPRFVRSFPIPRYARTSAYDFLVAIATAAMPHPAASGW
jgi:hypothetical protein